MADVTARRLDLASSALMEISEITDVLQDLVAERDEAGTLVYVARGILARIKRLSEATAECIEGDDLERWSDSTIDQVVHCRRAQLDAEAESAEELAVDDCPTLPTSGLRVVP